MDGGGPMSVAEQFTQAAFHPAAGDGWLFDPYGWPARPYIVPDAATRRWAARWYAWACVCGLLLAAGWVVALVAYRDPHGFPDPVVFFGGLAGLHAVGFGLTWVVIRPAVRGLARAPVRPPRPSRVQRWAAKESADTLAHIALAGAGLAIGAFVLAFFRAPTICVFASLVIGRAAFVAWKASRLRWRMDAEAAEPTPVPDGRVSD